MAVSACGLCGKARLEAVYQRLPEIEPMGADIELVRRLPERMRRHQALFERTGGLHGAALFDEAGEMIELFEDVGRHNAVDKLIGASLRRRELPWRRRIVVVSARAGFEIVQKVMMAAAPVLVAVGAASSLAHEVALRGGLELHTFVRPDRSNRHLPGDAP
jgi:FdhD protein